MHSRVSFRDIIYYWYKSKQVLLSLHMDSWDDDDTRLDIDRSHRMWKHSSMWLMNEENKFPNRIDDTNYNWHSCVGLNVQRMRRCDRTMSNDKQRERERDRDRLWRTSQIVSSHITSRAIVLVSRVRQLSHVLQHTSNHCNHRHLSTYMHLVSIVD